MDLWLYFDLFSILNFSAGLKLGVLEYYTRCAGNGSLIVLMQTHSGINIFSVGSYSTTVTILRPDNKKGKKNTSGYMKEFFQYLSPRVRFKVETSGDKAFKKLLAFPLLIGQSSDNGQCCQIVNRENF